MQVSVFQYVIFLFKIALCSHNLFSACVAVHFSLDRNQSTSFIIPHAKSCEGYNVFDPSVRQSTSPPVPLFSVSATPLKPLQVISYKFVGSGNFGSFELWQYIEYSD